MKRLVPIALAAAVLANSSCHMFSSKKNPAAPKESQTVASDVEKDFMRRWVDKRSAELVAQGSSPTAAHDQAVSEFKATYTYVGSSRPGK